VKHSVHINLDIPKKYGFRRPDEIKPTCRWKIVHHVGKPVSERYELMLEYKGFYEALTNLKIIKSQDFIFWVSEHDIDVTEETISECTKKKDPPSTEHGERSTV